MSAFANSKNWEKRIMKYVKPRVLRARDIKMMGTCMSYGDSADGCNTGIAGGD